MNCGARFEVPVGARIARLCPACQLHPRKRPRVTTCEECQKTFELSLRGRVPRRCVECRTPPPQPPRPTSGNCEECNAEFDIPKMGTVPKLCATCRADWRLLEERRRSKRETELEPRLHESLVQARLRIEAAKPLLRMAMMKMSWGLVQAALAELEGDHDDHVLDIRRIVNEHG